MRISIVDAGEMGTAMAVFLANAGHDVTLIIQPFDYPHIELERYLECTGKNKEGKRENNLHLPGIELPMNLKYSSYFLSISEADVVFLAVPSKFLQLSYIKIRSFLAKNKKCTLVLLSKGWDESAKQPWGVRLQTDLKDSIASQNFVVLSGYTPAYHIANAHLTLFSYAASAGSANLNAINKMYNLFYATRLGIVGTNDVIGVSWGGLLKNAYAIGYGILTGCKKSEFAGKYLDMAHLEMKVFLKHFGASEKTWDSPAVKGDFYLTSQGQIDWKSRNVAFGEFLGTFQSKTDIQRYAALHTVEGFEALKALFDIAYNNSLMVPLLYAINRIVEFGASPRTLTDGIKFS